MRPTLAAVLLLAPTLLACVPRDDDYLLMRRTNADSPARLELAAPNDAEAYYVRHLLASGFGAELLRTYAMAKRFAAHATSRPETPTRIALGTSDASEQRVPDRSIKVGWWRSTIAGDAPIIWIDDSPARRDRSTMVDLVSGLGAAIVDVVARKTADDGADLAALRAGYIGFLQVVAAEWRPPQVIDDRDELRRLRVFVDVRLNRAVRRQEGRPREMLGDPAVVATVLYRLASSELGQKMADPAVYQPFLEARPPRDVHPALLLGAFRNFQAKLLAAWSRAVTANRPPRDLIDLVEAYADAYPAERATATRIFLVTTYGATALPAGVRADATPDVVESQLAMLTADVLFGRHGLRDGLRTH